MTEEQKIIYQILLWALPLLLAVLGFIGALMVNQLIKLANTVNDIKVIIKGIDAKHDNLRDNHEHLESRVGKLEEKIFA